MGNSDQPNGVNKWVAEKLNLISTEVKIMRNDVVITSKGIDELKKELKEVCENQAEIKNCFVRTDQRLRDHIEAHDRYGESREGRSSKGNNGNSVTFKWLLEKILPFITLVAGGLLGAFLQHLAGG